MIIPYLWSNKIPRHGQKVVLWHIKCILWSHLQHVCDGTNISISQVPGTVSLFSQVAIAGHSDFSLLSTQADIKGVPLLSWSTIKHLTRNLYYTLEGLSNTMTSMLLLLCVNCMYEVCVQISSGHSLYVTMC